jgi:hypothetical protein
MFNTANAPISAAPMYTFRPMALALSAELVLAGALPVAVPVEPAEPVLPGAAVAAAVSVAVAPPAPMLNWVQTLAPPVAGERE